MARPSYGPEAKKRSLQLLIALLDYANDDLDCDEAALEGLRPQIQTHWQTEQRFVVRTKVRFLETLTKLAKTPLSAEQIKEALRRLEDLLGILEDNRPNRGGSEVWHFTLNLWHQRRDRTANLQRFEREWEHCRSQKSKLSNPSVSEPESSSKESPSKESFSKESPSKTVASLPSSLISPQASTDLQASGFLTAQPPDQSFWFQLCRESLEAQQYQRLTINPLTAADGVRFDLHELYLPLGLVERKQQNRRDTPLSSAQGSQLYGPEDREAVLSLEEFFVRLQTAETHRVAIVGEPGAGKTTVLQKIAARLLEQQALPIWVSLADLQGVTLEQYLLQDWLKQATQTISVPLELQEGLAKQFSQGRVWLLLDAIDEMAADAATALSMLARQIRGWIAQAHIVLTCRLNVWDNGKNALEMFTTYCNLSFSAGERTDPDQVGQFIDRWFQPQVQTDQTLSLRLQQALNQPERQRLKDAVKNPLRLALLCHSWSLTQGTLPTTKTLLYQQFVEAIYEWKQDRFPTTPWQRQQLNCALGQVALSALTQATVGFRLPTSLIQSAFAAFMEFMPLALQLGWLNQVGISPRSGEKVYAFYHPTFQEYFAAQTISDWRFFLRSDLDWPVFHSRWREVILLWLGRTDVAIAEKEAFLEALITFADDCGGFYFHRAYFLAAAGLAEFPQFSRAEAIVQKLLEWRFGVIETQRSYPTPVTEGARVALLQTDRPLAIAGLEQFLQSHVNPFACWNAAYTLGKTLAPGHPAAIAKLMQLLEMIQNETIRLQMSDSLGKIDPGNSIAIETLMSILESTLEDTIRRKAAYSLGKIDPGNGKAIAALEDLLISASDPTLRLQTAENLQILVPQHELASTVIQAIRKKKPKPRSRRSSELVQEPPSQRAIASLERKLSLARDADHERRIAYRLSTLQPGHPGALQSLLRLLCSPHPAALHKRTVENLKEVLLEEHLADVVTQLKPYSLIHDRDQNQWISQRDRPQAHECYRLLWFCAQRMTYDRFFQAWHR